jgi:cytochrome P450
LFDSSTDKLEDLDLKAYKDSYDTILSGLFDKQFGLLDIPREEEFQKSIKYLEKVFYKLIDQRRKEADETDDKENTKVKDLLDILISNNDPETEKPFTDELVSFLHLKLYLFVCLPVFVLIFNTDL